MAQATEAMSAFAKVRASEAASKEALRFYCASPVEGRLL
jgi:hypothetical protein